MGAQSKAEGEGMPCPSPIPPTTFAEEQDSWPIPGNESSAGVAAAAAATADSSMLEDVNSDDKDVDVNIPEEAIPDAGEDKATSILDQTALSESSHLEDLSPGAGDPSSQYQGKRNTYAKTIGISLLVGIVVGLVAFGIGKAVRRDKDTTQTFQGLQGDVASPSSDVPGCSQSSSPNMAPPPANSPAGSATVKPADAPSNISNQIPADSPTTTEAQTMPTKVPSNCPSAAPTYLPATYIPGNLTREEVGLLLSEGLRARIIATTGEPVQYHNGSQSDEFFHGRPDFGATFADTRPFNDGGWVYASNSEMPDKGEGGVGSITFDKNGNVIDYRMVLVNTTMNCGGGKSPWGTWISCEEIESLGEIYQVDPFGEIEAEKATIGSQLGRWESFAYDVRDPQDPMFFATEDHNKGTTRRFRPESTKVDWDNPWAMLHVNGTIDYLVVFPDENMTGGTFEWTDDIELAKNNAREFYPQTEGIDVYEGQMYLVCKGIKQMFVFDLDEMTYYNETTVSGLFDGGPDQMKRILDGPNSDLLYFTEEGGVDAGIHARDELGRSYTVLESPVYPDETTGLSFSPDAIHMYIAYQETGLLFDIWREDGLPFGGRTLNVKYHQAVPPVGI